jgi:hypothetical protein
VDDADVLVPHRRHRLAVDLEDRVRAATGHDLGRLADLGREGLDDPLGVVGVGGCFLVCHLIGLLVVWVGGSDPMGDMWQVAEEI